MTHALLVSPDPLDGYPPVQYQARLLARAGCEVTVVTTSLRREGGAPVSFQCAGVEVISLPPPTPGKINRYMRAAAHVAAIARVRHGNAAKRRIEIAYDPIGIFYSDLAPFRPACRVAHFHELLWRPDMFLERRLPTAIRNYQHVVVADESRAVLTRDSLQIPDMPEVVENFPLLAPAAGEPTEWLPQQFFDVVYCGSLGLNQRLDFIIDSVPQWPVHARLVLIGNDQTPLARQLKLQARHLGLENRVLFTGWLDLEEAERRMYRAQIGICLLREDHEQLRTALGASNKRYQYMKAGLPQIGDTNPGIPELIEGNGIGYCLRSTAPAELAEAIRSYMENPHRRRQDGVRALAAHRERFNYESAFSRFMEKLLS